ncbi:transmembrane protein 94-like [Mytilus trossulus]|uniref:transmembrane protein 94-like n=1 Tax=Mytilus trossulus TaxID=6551 RepID=UPI0030079C73
MTELDGGLCTADALSTLHDELENEIIQYEDKLHASKTRKLLRCLNPYEVKSAFHCTSIIILSLLSVALVVAFGAFLSSSLDSNPFWWIIEVVVWLIVLALNITNSIWNCHIELKEIINVARLTLKKIKDCLKAPAWTIDDYVNIHTPLSPCVSLQWTLRDNQVVNLPVPLLVAGDVILLRPGHIVPGSCRQLEADDKEVLLNQGEMYCSTAQEDPDYKGTPHNCKPVTAQKFVMLETVFLQNLRTMLEDEFPRPVTVIENERYLIASHLVERRLIPVVFAIMLLVNILRYIYMPSHSGHWTEMFLVLQVHIILPMVPALYPLLWRILDIYGQARVFSASHTAKYTKVDSESSFSSDSTISEDDTKLDVNYNKILSWFWSILQGDCSVVTRRVNITQVLGSITSLCCVDKKGILSWPNPTAEKVFFLSSNTKKPAEENIAINTSFSSGEKSKIQTSAYGSLSHTEVLDLTHHSKDAFGLQFDDSTWLKHITSLKPLGLNILANTCNKRTRDWYTQFTDHVACVALEREDTVAVINRRCLCELARQIGFTKKALDIFELDRTLGMYRQVSAEESAKERVNRSKSFVQHKIPMPNMVSVVLKDSNSGMSQVLSQGTADILLDCCSDYWNGEDVSTFTESDRKKILDFYHRTSMASYCTAFSYRPLTQQISASLDGAFIQLPQNWACMSRDISTSVDSDIHMMPFDSTSLYEDNRAYSMDSLFDTTSTASVDDVGGCCNVQCNQIFIGMVTMQYQARQEFVQLIDKLEVACIRFVHFSNENEVRSRVFSEKMGLEAGWNCHISLLSEQETKSPLETATSQTEIAKGFSRHSSRHSSDVAKDKSFTSLKAKYSKLQLRSQSAPSIVNLSSSQVRFEMNEAVTISENGILDEVSIDGKQKLLYGIECQEDSDYCLSNKDSDGESRHASSYLTENTEDSITGPLDNRAKLPRGIENIRPHLQSIDNVPLLVNLFTDCTPETTEEMMRIMQENDEVVLCVGSSLNINNTNMFMQADCSFSLEPHYPQICAKQALNVERWCDDRLSPTQLANVMISIPCPLMFRRDDYIGLVQIVAEARTFLMSQRNCFYLMLCYHLSISLSQVLASIVLLPPVLSSQHLLWLLFIVVPALSLTLMGNPVDPRVMNNATSKNPEYISTQMVLQFLCCFLLRFVPFTCISILCFGLTLNSLCDISSCSLYSFSHNNSTQYWYDDFSESLPIAQNVFLFFFVLYLICTSVGFVHWFDHLWQKSPTTNKLWTCVIPLVLVGQVIVSVCDIFLRSKDQSPMSFSNIHPAVYAVGFSFPLVIIGVNELVKKYEINIYTRYQKRTRLNFGTKLGMNSPF